MDRIVRDEHGLEKIVLRTVEGETADVYLHGAHVTSWRSPQGADYLFLSKKAIFKPPKPIRGGIPVCFPQFGPLGSLPQHGFARNSAFEVEELHGDWGVTLLLRHAGDQGYSAHFELRIKVSLCEGALQQEMRVTNTGSDEMSFTGALHTYYAVDDISTVKVEGLQGVTYKDSLDGGKQVVEAQGAVTFASEVDRIYCSAPDVIKVAGAAPGRSLTLTKAGFPDAVVWNPWVAKAQAMADFGDEEYKVMLCIEPAVAGSGPVTLPPGQTWTGTQTLTMK